MNEVEKDALRRDYVNRLQHTIIAYRYLASAIPKDAMFVGDRHVEVGRFCFRKQADALSMRVELGWAFFVRLEAVLEAFVSRLGIRVSQKSSLFDHLVGHGVEFTEDQAKGLGVYRELRNTLHHGNGDTRLLHRKPSFLNVDGETEPHLFDEHIERFVTLFKWLGEVLPSTV